MQQTGTLKKRRRRNLSNVNGLSSIPYDEASDSFTGRNLFGNDDAEADHSTSHIFSQRTSVRTTLSFSRGKVGEFRRLSRMSSRSRVTRNPIFHNIKSRLYGEVKGSADEELDAWSERHSAAASNRASVANVDDRSHFMSRTAMSRLKLLIWIGKLVGLFPWIWSKKEYRIVKWSPTYEKLWWIQWFLVTVQTIVLLCLQVYVFAESFWTTTERTNRQVFMSCFGILWYVYAFGYNLNWFLFKEKVRQYINSMLQFNHDSVNKYLIHLDDYEDRGGAVINLCYFGSLSQIFISASLFLRMPFMPWYLFSYIYPKPWYWLIPGTLHDVMLVGHVIVSYLLLAWIIFAHANTLQFWLREMHNNNDSDYTTDNLRRPGNAIATYKILQVLNVQFNECMAPLSIFWMKFVIGSALVPCGYVMIRSMNHLFIDEFPGILMYPLSIPNCAVAALVLLSITAEVFDLGCSFIDSWSRTKQMDFRRILMSCPSLKIWVGREYFITVTTTITYFKVIFDFITDCIIAFP